MSLEPTLVYRFCCQGTDEGLARILEIVHLRHSEALDRENFKELVRQIKQSLGLRDCKTLAPLLRLIEAITAEIPEGLKDVWPLLHTTVTGLEELHIPLRPYCRSCAEINTSYYRLCESLAKVASKQAQQCVFCRNEGSVVMRCTHRICIECCGEKRKLYKEKKAKDVYCPIDHQLISKTFLKTELEKFGKVNQQAEKRSREVLEKKDCSSPNGPNPADKYSCPKCKSTLHLGSVLFLAECLKCDSIFCSNCMQNYHGYTECATASKASHSGTSGVASRPDPSPNFSIGQTYQSETKSQYVTRAKSNAEKELEDLLVSKVHGAVARPHELEYYKTIPHQPPLFSDDEIANAFPTPDVILPEGWEGEEPHWESSWERISSHAIGPNIGKYGSLSEGSWVDDCVLEDALNAIARMCEGKVSAAVLESYLVNWSMRKDHGVDNPIISAIAEKRLTEKEVGIALINTDLKGPGGHWILGAFHIKEKKIFLFDSSLVVSETFYRKFFFGILHILHIAFNLVKQSFHADEWKLILSLDSVQQENSYDCGPLAVCNAYAFLTQRRQVDRLPKSYQMRWWIQNVLMQDKRDYEVLKTDCRIERSSANIQVKEFTPRLLSISYEFLKQRQLFSLPASKFESAKTKL